MKFIKKEEIAHQVIFLVDEANVNDDYLRKHNDFVRKISQTVPSLSVTFNNVTHLNIIIWLIGENLRGTTIFILITNANESLLNSRLSAPMNIIMKISHSYTLPKCLIVHLSNDQAVTYEKILKSL